MKFISGFVVTFAVVILSLTETSLSAQQLFYEVEFENYFDNREYRTDGGVEPLSGSDFVVRLVPKLELRFGQGNSLNVGAEMNKSLGGGEGLLDGVEAIIYYGYDTDRWRLSAGIFERDRAMMEGYSTAFFSDDYLLRDNLIEGLAFRYMSGDSYAEAICDWESQPTESRRERFRILSSARRCWRGLYVGYNLSLTHFAGTRGGRFSNVVDYALINPCCGASFGIWEVRLSYLLSAQRDRRFDSGWLYPAIGEVAIGMEYRGFGVDEIFYFGDDMMPLYAGHILEDGAVMEYGSQLYTGSIFFRACGGYYNRTALRYERRFCSDRVAVMGEFVTHINGDGLSTEQILRLEVRLGGKLLNWD